MPKTMILFISFQGESFQLSCKSFVENSLSISVTRAMWITAGTMSCPKPEKSPLSVYFGWPWPVPGAKLGIIRVKCFRSHAARTHLVYFWNGPRRNSSLFVVSLLKQSGSVLRRIKTWSVYLYMAKYQAAGVDAMIKIGSIPRFYQSTKGLKHCEAQNRCQKYRARNTFR